MLPNHITSHDPTTLLVIVDGASHSDAKDGGLVKGREGWLLDSMLREAGLSRSKINLAAAVRDAPAWGKEYSYAQISHGKREIEKLVDELNPNAILTLGVLGANAILDSTLTEGEITMQRGFVFTTSTGASLTLGVSIGLIQSTWIPWRLLTTKDIKRAKQLSQLRGVTRPLRVVHVVDDSNIAVARGEIMGAQDCAADIEIFDDATLACIGFAPSLSKAYVFPPQYFSAAFAILKQRRCVWANGQFDLHFLSSRYGIRAGLADDTQLAWHSCYPELAGQAKDETRDKQKSKTTRKSLSFLSSLFTLDEWWKDYEFATERERYELNGRDCCITLDIMLQLKPLIAGMDVEDIYKHSRDLVWPCVDMQTRGLLVDEKLRVTRMTELQTEIDEITIELEQKLIPRILAEWDKLPPKRALFEQKWTCPCCRNGKKKLAHCWQCAGFAKYPTIKAWEAKGETVVGKIADWNVDHLTHCQVCEGKGQRKFLRVNGDSEQQQKIILYSVLKLPKRTKRGKLRSDEAVIKDLRAQANDEQAEILDLMLRVVKLSTMHDKQYARLAPGFDGRIRTVLSPSGTETGRFGSKATFLEASTNLQNLPKKTAVQDPRYNVRECILAEPGRMLIEVDYASAERRLLAYLAEEAKAIEQIEQGINSYKWFAGLLYGLGDKEAQEMPKKDPRYHVGKTSILSLDRGVSWRRLMESVNKDADITGAAIPAAVARRAEALFHSEYTGYVRYYDHIRQEIQTTGYLRNVMGRRRDFFGRKNDANQMAAVVREGVSFMAQAVGDIINAALIRIYAKADPHTLRLLLQVHDAIVADAHPEHQKEVARIICEEMQRPILLPTGYSLVIPAEVSYSMENWASMKDL